MTYHLIMGKRSGVVLERFPRDQVDEKSSVARPEQQADIARLECPGQFPDNKNGSTRDNAKVTAKKIPRYFTKRSR